MTNEEALGPRDQDLDAACFDEEAHLQQYGFGLHGPEDLRDDDEQEEDADGEA